MMMPSLPATAQALWIFVPRKYRLSATLAGSAYQVSFAGGAGAFPAGPFGGGMHRRRNVPAHSRPAAFFAVLISPSTVGRGVCADAGAIEMAKTTAATIIPIHFIGSS